MINLTIGKTTDTNGATLYTLTPSPVVLGNQNANAVDEVQVAGIPAEWAGLTIRAVFVPTPGAAVACILDENGRCTVSASFTGNRGEIVVDAFGEDYHAYTTPARYAVARHQDISATVDPEYTPTQVEQILAQAQTYANSAEDARDAAQDAAASIQDLTVSAETLPAGSDASVTKTETPTGINLEFGIPRGADGNITDVTLNGSSIVTDGVADIPKADATNKWGAVRIRQGFGIYTDSNGAYLVKAANSEIDGRTNQYNPIVSYNLDYAVKAAMTDGRGAAWTAAEQLAGRERLGFGGNWVTLIDETLTADESVVRTFDPCIMAVFQYMFPAGSSVPSAGAAAFYYSQTQHILCTGWISAGSNFSADRYGSVTGYSIGGYWFASWSDHATNPTTNGGLFGGAWGGYSRCFVDDTTTYPYVDKLQSNTTLPAGTRVIIRGIRA